MQYVASCATAFCQLATLPISHSLALFLFLFYSSITAAFTVRHLINFSLNISSIQPSYSNKKKPCACKQLWAASCCASRICLHWTIYFRRTSTPPVLITRCCVYEIVVGVVIFVVIVVIVVSTTISGMAQLDIQICQSMWFERPQIIIDLEKRRKNNSQTSLYRWHWCHKNRRQWTDEEKIEDARPNYTLVVDIIYTTIHSVEYKIQLIFHAHNLWLFLYYVNYAFIKSRE